MLDMWVHPCPQTDPDLIAAIEKYMQVHNVEPKPFVWTATAESILAKVRRGRVALNQNVSQ